MIFHGARALSMSIRNRRVRRVIVIAMMPLSSINSSVETSSGTGLRRLERVLVKKRSDLAVHGPDLQNLFPLCKVFLVVSYLAVGWFYCELPVRGVVGACTRIAHLFAIAWHTF